MVNVQVPNFDSFMNKQVRFPVNNEINIENTKLPVEKVELEEAQTYHK